MTASPSIHFTGGQVACCIYSGHSLIPHYSAQFWPSNQPYGHVFGQWEETGGLGGNPHREGEKVSGWGIKPTTVSSGNANRRSTVAQLFVSTCFWTSVNVWHFSWSWGCILWCYKFIYLNVLSQEWLLNPCLRALFLSLPLHLSLSLSLPHTQTRISVFVGTNMWRYTITQHLTLTILNLKTKS